jgi:hypothetical protein
MSSPYATRFILRAAAASACWSIAWQLGQTGTRSRIGFVRRLRLPAAEFAEVANVDIPGADVAVRLAEVDPQILQEVPWCSMHC